MNTNRDLWWLWMLRAAATAAFAMIAVAFPPLTTSLAIYLYGGYVKLDGFVLIGLNANGTIKRPWLVLAGVLALVSGVAVLMWPTASSISLLYTLAALAIARGVMECVQTEVNDLSGWQRALRFAGSGLIITFGLVLGAHEPLSRAVLVTAFALHAFLLSCCHFAIGLELWSHRIHDRTPPKPRGAHVRAPLSGLPI